MSVKVDHRRPNFFIFPHKLFRFMWAEVVQELGRCNFYNEDGLKKMGETIDFAIKAYAEHNHDESTYFAPLLKVKGGDAAKVVDDWIKDHDGHVEEMNKIKTHFEHIVAAKDMAVRREKMQHLYEHASNFLAEDLKHMHFEEHTVMAHFQAHFTDAELDQIEIAFIKQMDPRHLQSLTPMFLRAGNLDDRTKVLGAIKMNAPPQAFEGVLHGLAPTIVPADEMEEIKKRLAGPPPAQP